MKNSSLLLVFACVAAVLLAPAFGRATLQDRENAIEVKNGTVITRTSEGVSVQEPHRSSPRFFPNVERSVHEKRTGTWQTSLWATGTAYNYFYAYWFVPPKPTTTSDGQILYFFNSFEDSTETEILQPVLQWNKGSIAGWSLASWYGSSAGYYFSTPVAVNAGDSICGFIYQSGSNWIVDGYVNGALISTITVAQRVISATQPYAQLVLESYYVTECTDYPPSEYIRFDYIDIWDGANKANPTWVADVYSTTCGETATSTPLPTLTWTV